MQRPRKSKGYTLKNRVNRNKDLIEQLFGAYHNSQQQLKLYEDILLKVVDKVDPSILEDYLDDTEKNPDPRDEGRGDGDDHAGDTGGGASAGSDPDS